jgi:hypothetical protein
VHIEVRREYLPLDFHGEPLTATVWQQTGPPFTPPLSFDRPPPLGYTSGLLSAYIDGQPVTVDALREALKTEPAPLDFPGGSGTLTGETCQRCGHPPHWHRHDDEACLTRHPQPCEPLSAPFRCLGYDCDKPGFPAGTPESRCGCPDFVEARP